MSDQHPVRRQIIADVLLLLVTLIWGSTFVMVKGATESYPVFAFLAIRFGLAAVVLIPFSLRKLRSLGWRGVGAGALIGLFLFSGYAFQTIGLRSTSASKTGFITGLSVVIVPVLSAFVLRRRPAVGAAIGVGMATVGLGLLTLDSDLSIALGDLYVLLCALSFALHIVSVSAFAPKMDALALTLVQVVTVALISGIIALLTPEGFGVPDGDVWFAAAFTGVLATAVAFALQTATQRFTTPTHTALIFAGEPVFAAVFGVLLAGETMTARGIAGGILIVAGTIASEIRWTDRTARIISRFLGPNYVSIPLLIAMGCIAPGLWWQRLLWVVGTAILSVGVAVPYLLREQRHGRISDWHISDRRERVQPRLIALSFVASAVPLGVLLWLNGPPQLVVVFFNTVLLVILTMGITFFWKISQHVTVIASITTMLTAVFGMIMAPVLLLVPLVAWARIRIKAHTPWQTIAGATAGVGVTLFSLSVFGLL